MAISATGASTGLVGGLGKAAEGLKSNLQRFERAATEVTRQATKLSSSEPGASSDGDLAGALADQMTAKHGVLASTKTLRAFDEMLVELTQLGARR